MQLETLCCEVCPSKCHATKHVISQERFELIVVIEEMTLDTLKKSHLVALKGRNDAESLVKHLQSRYNDRYSEILSLILEAYDKVCQLDKIALKPSSKSIKDYLSLLISSMEHEGKPGWMERIRILKEIWEEMAKEGVVEAVQTGRLGAHASSSIEAWNERLTQTSGSKSHHGFLQEAACSCGNDCQGGTPRSESQVTIDKSGYV